jgi:sugar phosphate isomerase/epimerase
MHTRRNFLQTAVAAGAALALPATAGAIEPIRRNGKAHLRLSLAAYSYNRHLALKGKAKPTMTLEDFIDTAAGMDLPAVELTAYYFPRTTPEYLAAIKGRCTRLGLDVSGTAVGNNFCVASPDALRTQLNSVKSWVEHSARLGAKTMRIFAGNAPRGEDVEAVRKRCVAAIQEACDHAAKHGIFLALENHGGITATADQLLALVRAVKHDWFGVNLDTGNFHTPDPYADMARAAPYAVVCQVKTEVFPAGKQKEEADLSKVLGILRKAHFRGYVALEYEAREDPKTAVPRYVAALKKLVG